MACSNLQLCARTEAGIKGAVHVVMIRREQRQAVAMEAEQRRGDSGPGEAPMEEEDREGRRMAEDAGLAEEEDPHLPRSQETPEEASAFLVNERNPASRAVTEEGIPMDFAQLTED
eukprot:7257122-Ditylum_brightwellii.AAC.1